MLTQKQKTFLLVQKITVNGIYMFPSWGFVAYKYPDPEMSHCIDNNPFTRSLDHERFLVKEIKPDSKYVRGNFYRRPLANDFYLLKEELEERPMILVLLLTIICYVPFTVYNLFKKPLLL